MRNKGEKAQRYLCMLFKPSIHGLFVRKIDVSYLTLAFIVRSWEIHSRYLA